MKSILFVCDYKGNFLSKWGASPYRSGLNKSKLMQSFKDKDYQLEFCNTNEVLSLELDNFEIIFLTSQEDPQLLYKSFVEDVAFYLEEKKKSFYPPLNYLKAHHNKVFMELIKPIYLKNMFLDEKVIDSKTRYFGTLEDLVKEVDTTAFDYPVVIKSAEGASSKGVLKCNNKNELIKNAKKLSRSRSVFYEAWDFMRSLKHSGYKKESFYRNKFIIQSFIPNLNGDYKVLVFGTKYFVLERGIKSGDFRASGSGLLKYTERLPENLLSLARDIKSNFNVPYMAMDIAEKDNDYYLIEYQFVNFGTHTVETAPFYFQETSNGFKTLKWEGEIEGLFCESILGWLKSD